MSVKDWIFGAPKLVDNVFDKDKGLLTQVGQWIGHQSLSDEEKIIHDKAMGDAVRGFAVATMGESTERSKTRRELALLWFRMHVFFIRMTFLAAVIDHLIIRLEGQEGYELFNLLFSFTFNPWLCGITGGIGLFFWGSHALRSSKLAK